MTATVTNTGQLATHVARGADLAGNREDAIWLIGDRDRVRNLQGGAWQSLGTIDGTLEIPDAEPEQDGSGNRRVAQAARPSPVAMQRMQQRSPGGSGSEQQVPPTGNTREVTWLVAIEGNSPLKIVLTSQKGGTEVRELTVR